MGDTEGLAVLLERAPATRDVTMLELLEPTAVMKAGPPAGRVSRPSSQAARLPRSQAVRHGRRGAGSQAGPAERRGVAAAEKFLLDIQAVSYTHLTLPTIYSV